MVRNGFDFGSGYVFVKIQTFSDGIAYHFVIFENHFESAQKQSFRFFYEKQFVQKVEKTLFGGFPGRFHVYFFNRGHASQIHGLIEQRVCRVFKTFFQRFPRTSDKSIRRMVQFFVFVHIPSLTKTLKESSEQEVFVFRLSQYL
jgi:hypothetical protein